MKVIILKSKPGTRFHFGKALGAFTEESHNTQKITSDYLHSDTLWSALVSAWALSSPETVDDFIAQSISGAFKISSAFFCYTRALQEDNNGYVYFLPKPATLNLFKFSKPKLLKKVKFISKGIWESGLSPDEWFDSEKCTLLQNKTAVALKSEIEKSFNLFAIETAAKTSSRNITKREDTFYFQTDLFLLNNVQWYFFIENNLTENLQSDFKKGMNALVNFGIGGERSTGCGSITGYEELEIDFNFIGDYTTDEKVSVSLTLPDKNELTKNALYHIIKRGGRFIENGKSLPMVQMISEGSVLNNDVKGRIVELYDQPKVLRYGMSFLIPLHFNFLTANY